MVTADPSPNLLLASRSPRRIDFLREAGLSFEVAHADIDETRRPGEAVDDYVERLASEKARAVAPPTHAATTHPPLLVIAADTSVALGERIMGKPADPEDAREMLEALSGTTHRVVTGVCLLQTYPRRERCFHVSTDVHVRRLLPSEIAAYVQSGSPFDKAGAYGIQDRAGSMIQAINGSYTNVVGLPMAELLDALLAWGVPLP